MTSSSRRAGTAPSSRPHHASHGMCPSSVRRLGTVKIHLIDYIYLSLFRFICICKLCLCFLWLGVNTDPSYSNGHLCCTRIEKKEGQTENFKTYIQRLRVRPP